MKKNYILFVVFLLSLLVMLPALAHADDPTIVQLNEMVKSKADQISLWRSQARMLTILTLIVGILGAISGILSQIKSRWAKFSVAAAGGCVAIITVIINTAYPVDYRTYNKLTCEAQMIVDDVRLQISELQNITDMKKRDEIIFKNILIKLQALTNIGKQVAYNADVSFAISEAYAQQTVPSWVTNPPKDSSTLYFVGHGVSKDPSKAENTATDYAKETARILILDVLVESGQSKENPANSRILKSILEGSEVLKNFVKYDAQQNTYRDFCLLKIDIETIQFRLRLLVSKDNITVPSSFIDLLKKKSAT